MNYVVTRTGNYINNVFGPYPDRRKAYSACELLAMADIDRYHDWEVRAITENGLGSPIRTLQGSVCAQERNVWRCADRPPQGHFGYLDALR